jgi:hypothetical protein
VWEVEYIAYREKGRSRSWIAMYQGRESGLRVQGGVKERRKKVRTMKNQDPDTSVKVFSSDESGKLAENLPLTVSLETSNTSEGV